MIGFCRQVKHSSHKDIKREMFGVNLKRGNQPVLIASKPDLRVQSKSTEPIHSSRFGIKMSVKFADNLCRYQVAHVYIIEIPFEILD